LVAFAIEPSLAIVFLAAYALLLCREVRNGAQDPDDEEELAPLKIHPREAFPELR
jgi:hypothetical protein